MNAIKRFPVTIGVLTAVVGVALLTASHTAAEQARLLDRVGMDLDSLRAWRLWTVPVALFVQSSPGIEWHMLLLVSLPLLALEYLDGSLRALIAFVLSDWLTAPVTVLVLWALSGLGSSASAAFLHQPDAGSSAAAHGALAAAIVQFPRWLAIAGLSILLGISLYALTFEQLDAAIAHLLGIGVGLAIGLIYRNNDGSRIGTSGGNCIGPSSLEREPSD